MHDHEVKHHHSKFPPLPPSFPGLICWVWSLMGWDQPSWLCPISSSAPSPPCWWGGVRRGKGPNSVRAPLSTNWKHPCIISAVSRKPKAQPHASCCERNRLYSSQTQCSLFFENILYHFCILFVEPRCGGMLDLFGAGRWWQAVLLLTLQQQLWSNSQAVLKVCCIYGYLGYCLLHVKL